MGRAAAASRFWLAPKPAGFFQLILFSFGPEGRGRRSSKRFFPFIIKEGVCEGEADGAGRDL